MTAAPSSSDRTVSASVAAFFDVDNTLLPGEASEVRFFRWLWRRRVVGWPEARISAAWWLRHLPSVSLQPLRERKLYLAGKPAQVIEPLGEEFCREQLCPGVSPSAMTAMDRHREAGHLIILLTGSLEFLIEPIADSLQVHRCIASRLEIVDGVYTGNVRSPMPYGEGKRTVMARLAHEFELNLDACFAYGDSPGDEAMLSAVGHPTVVNPIRGMDKIARRNGWPVVSWR
ncbi:MAG: HAD family hydrolase [Nitrospira sp.]